MVLPVLKRDGLCPSREEREEVVVRIPGRLLLTAIGLSVFEGLVDVIGLECPRG